ncbi:ribosome maturation factor RimM [Arhodomonas sp. SL1]|uniref:ribosome maturation factor RimM n=1 Tax=Arhodomonas sp. SL1 TaxID=3425691 RepID=UPI003F8805E8
MGRGDDEEVVLGEVVGVHGVHGAVKVFSWTRPVENIFEYRQWWLVSAGAMPRPHTLLEGWRQGKGLVARLEGIEDRDAARALMGARVTIPRHALPDPESGEYYWHDLIGLRVVNADGVSLGEVEDLIETGAHDVLVVSGERERLIPFVPGEYVTRVDLAAGLLEVDWNPED